MLRIERYESWQKRNIGLIYNKEHKQLHSGESEGLEYKYSMDIIIEVKSKWHKTKRTNDDFETGTQKRLKYGRLLWKYKK